MTDNESLIEEPEATYSTNSYVDVMMMLYSKSIPQEVKRHIGLRLVEEANGQNLSKAFNRLNHFATLEKDWDGEGALPISRRVLDNLQHVLLISDDADWATWQMGPDSNGTIGLQSNSGDAFMSVGSEEFSYYAVKNGKEYHASHVHFSPLTFLNVMRQVG